MNILVFQFQ